MFVEMEVGIGVKVEVGETVGEGGNVSVGRKVEVNVTG